MRAWGYRGGEKIMLSLAECLTKKGHSVEVVAIRKEISAHNKSKKFKITYPNKFNNLLQNNLLAFVFGIFYIFIALRKKLKSTDLILTESDACLYGSALASMGTSKKLVWYAFDYNYKRKGGKISRILDIMSVRRVNKIITLSENIKQIIKEEFNKKVDILKPIINLEKEVCIKRDKPSKELINFYKNKKVLFLPATLHPFKNQELAIKLLAFKQISFPELVLVLAGEGGSKKRLQKLTKMKKIENKVYFSGILKGQALNFAYKNAFTTLVCSNTTSEGFSLTAIESLKANTPVIVSDVAGISTFLINNNLGIVKQPTLKAFSEGLDELNKDYDEYKIMLTGINKLIKNNFSQEIIYKNFMDIVNK